MNTAQEAFRTRAMRSPQFSTKQEVFRAYADLLDRHEEAKLSGLPPWTVIDADTGHTYTARPSFDRDPSVYMMPVAICEGAHVWIGDVLYTFDGAEVLITEKTKHLAEDLDLFWARPAQQRKTVKLLGYITNNSVLTHCTADSKLVGLSWQRVPSEDKEVEVL